MSQVTPIYGSNSRSSRTKRPPTRLNDYAVYKVDSTNHSPVPTKMGRNYGHEGVKLANQSSRVDIKAIVAGRRAHSQLNSRPVHTNYSRNMADSSNFDSSPVDLIVDYRYEGEPLAVSEPTPAVTESTPVTVNSQPITQDKVNISDQSRKKQMSGLEYQIGLMSKNGAKFQVSTPAQGWETIGND